MAEQGTEARWAHILWQKHNLPMEEFLDFPRKKKLAYIASEILENEDPVRTDSVLYYLKLMGGGG